ncbi:hypothetical protein BC937DRAFT_95245 [Endogone sp. FLAS-F59071]|nr:hypothetical protein BC937DRAFT_95245 [Endogone sp. FLAS-F59071]|eukprot:RUS13487.1 hypothetical protein BC937DRAFT_95245 [Endogone sp. FLAS-F59071]
MVASTGGILNDGDDSDEREYRELVESLRAKVGDEVAQSMLIGMERNGMLPSQSGRREDRIRERSSRERGEDEGARRDGREEWARAEKGREREQRNRLDEQARRENHVERRKEEEGWREGREERARRKERELREERARKEERERREERERKEDEERDRGESERREQREEQAQREDDKVQGQKIEHLRRAMEAHYEGMMRSMDEKYQEAQAGLEERVKTLEARLRVTTAALEDAQQQNDLLKLRVIAQRKEGASSKVTSAAESYRSGPTRELIQKDKIEHRYQLWKVNEMDSAELAAIIKQVILKLGVDDPSHVVPVLADVIRVVRLLPQMQRFIERVDRVVWAGTPSLVDDGGDAGSDREAEWSEAFRPPRKLIHTIAKLERWREVVEAIGPVEYRAGGRRRQVQRGDDDERIGRRTPAIESERDTFGTEERAVAPAGGWDLGERRKEWSVSVRRREKMNELKSEREREREKREREWENHRQAAGRRTGVGI